MLDVAGTIMSISLYGAVLGCLVVFSPMRAATRLLLLIGATAWLGAICLAAVAGIFSQGAISPAFPGGLAPFVVSLVLLATLWQFDRDFREALLAAPMALLVLLHAGRLGGVVFLLLWSEGRLSAPFATIAGLGDVITGGLALWIGVALIRQREVTANWLLRWNLFGALDLVVALVLGLLSAPGTPFRIFSEGPGTVAMTSLPWIFVPSLLVPLYLFLHFLIGVRLKSGTRGPISIAAGLHR
jgi:hypothetical protein